ncbi:MAG: hypothetical protein K2K53_02930 [Oscillospiraceae bacterium]|nr:hypothetical protein [Oscillospiraceae bacterium]
MKKLQCVSLIVLALTVILWTAGRVFLPLPDWAVRTNGIIMMAACAVLVFTSVRLLKKM